MLSTFDGETCEGARALPQAPHLVLRTSEGGKSQGARLEEGLLRKIRILAGDNAVNQKVIADANGPPWLKTRL
jgi:hypothetical protein